MKYLSELNPGISNRFDDINCEGETTDIPPLDANSTWHHQGWSGRQYKCRKSGKNVYDSSCFNLEISAICQNDDKKTTDTMQKKF